MQNNLQASQPFKEIVAVYGTLRPGFGNWKYTGLNTQKYLGTARTAAEYDLRCWGGCPGMYPNGNTSVMMSLFEVTDPKVFESLDGLEGHVDGRKSGYHREKIDFGGLEAWTYVYYSKGNSRGDKVLNGDWKQHKVGPYNELIEILNNAEEE